MRKLTHFFRRLFGDDKCDRCKGFYPKNNFWDGLCLDCYHQIVERFL